MKHLLLTLALLLGAAPSYADDMDTLRARIEAREQTLVRFQSDILDRRSDWFDNRERVYEGYESFKAFNPTIELPPIPVSKPGVVAWNKELFAIYQRMIKNQLYETNQLTGG